MSQQASRYTFEPIGNDPAHQVSKSPWGENDEIGRLNWITAETRRNLLEGLDGSGVFDLSVDYFIGMPSWAEAGDPKFDCWMTHTPVGSVIDNRSGAGSDVHEVYSYCGDSISMYTHCGTHLDTLNHMGFHGLFWNGWTPDQHLGSRGWTKGGADQYPPIMARGVLLDVAGLHRVDCLPDSYAITPDDLRNAAREQRLELRRGDIVLVRTGRMARWPNADYADDQPGISLASARYLLEDGGAMCLGSDTMSLEVLPSEDPTAFLPVHCYIFATAGAQILEMVLTDELAAERVYEFAFFGFPMKLRGATGAPIRPVAVTLR